MTPPDPSLRLASYNIQKCVGLDMRRKPQRTLKVLEAIGAEIAVLQEADKRLPPRPAALPHFMLDEAGWQIVDLGGAGSLGWHGNAVVWRSEAIRQTGMGHIALPGFEPRGAVWTTFDTPIGPLRVVGVHLGLLAASRRQQVLHLAADLARMPPCPTVWAGDFNDWARLPVLDHCAPAMRFLPPRPSFPAPRPLAPFDRIAHDDRLIATDHGVWSSPPARIASDHLPIWADLGRIR